MLPKDHITKYIAVVFDDMREEVRGLLFTDDEDAAAQYLKLNVGLNKSEGYVAAITHRVTWTNTHEED